ncbi:hypothetical protein GH714_026189 [Hevea brasiliensis]|uniref:Magnesium transporter n=1 Tax=Hevea brasiliensis TaxID=3981 RepID=A0A6A6NKC4_HEVBR|nr:hypothetical protein GH714_026189 [Hevea brasiliensis]
MGRDGILVPVESLKKKTAVSRSWILLDHNGQSTILDVDKYAIMRRVQIHARDLRILDPLLSYPSAILGREGVIVLNLEHIKAIITAEEVLLRDPLDDNVIPVVEELQRRLPFVNVTSEIQGEEEEHPGVPKDFDTGEENEFPFEFRALEVALEAICSFLDARTRELETDAYPALDELTSKISSRNLDRVRKLKSSMTRLTNRVQKVRDELEQLLDDDDDMADLYLSRKLAGLSSPVSGSGAPNWFLNSPTIGLLHADRWHIEQIDYGRPPCLFCRIVFVLLREYIDDTEDYINIQNSSSAEANQPAPNNETDNGAESWDGKSDLWQPLNCLVEVANRTKSFKPNSQVSDTKFESTHYPDNETHVCKTKFKENKDKTKVDDEKNNTDTVRSESTGPKRLRRIRRKKASNFGYLGISSQAVLDATTAKHERRAGPVWFSLVASEDQEGDAPLPQIPANYLRIKDGNLPVSFIQKYLMKKFDLVSEAEVEIKCMGQPVVPTLLLYNLVDLWIQTASTSERVSASIGSSAKDFVMVLAYARKVPDPE